MAREIRTRVRLWNYADEVLVQRGAIRPDEVRRVELEEVVVDTGSTMPVLNQEVIQRLGIPFVGDISVRYADHRTARKPMARGVVMEIMGRDGLFDAVVEERGQVLVGMEALERLDLWPDLQRGILTTNPLSPDIPQYNLLRSRTCRSP